MRFCFEVIALQLQIKQNNETIQNTHIYTLLSLTYALTSTGARFDL